MSLAALWMMLLADFIEVAEGRGGGGGAVQTGVGEAGSACSLELHTCIALVSGPTMGWGRQAAVVCFSWVGAHHTGDELN